MPIMSVNLHVHASRGDAHSQQDSAQRNHHGMTLIVNQVRMHYEWRTYDLGPGRLLIKADAATQGLSAVLRCKR